MGAGTLAGTVRCGTAPVAGAAVEVYEGGVVVAASAAGAAGQYGVGCSSGVYLVLVSSRGYLAQVHRIVLTSGTTTQLDVELVATDPDLVGWWPMDEGEGTLAFDRSGNGLHARFVNGPTWSTGAVTGACFDGVDDYLAVSSWSYPTVTMMAWVYQTSWTAAGAGGSVIMGRRPEMHVVSGDWTLYTNNWGTRGVALGLSVTGVNDVFTYFGPELQLSRRTHLAFAYDGTAVRTYMDGMLVGSAAAPFGPLPPSVREHSLGNLPFDHVSNRFAGVLGDVRLFARALTPVEIARYAQRMAGTVSGRVTVAGTAVPVAGARLVFRAETGSADEAVTDVDGRYECVLTSGTWSVSVSSIGFRSAVSTGVVVSLGSAISLDIALVQNARPVLAWTGEPGFESDGVAPDIGTPQTVFSFRVRYRDDDGDAPLAGYPRVQILKGGMPLSDSPVTLAYVGGTPSSGAVYAVERALPLGADYACRFEAFDREELQATGTPTVAMDIPDVVSEPLFRVQGVVHDGADPVPGVVLVLTGSGMGRTVTTGSEGAYKFADLPPWAAFEIIPAAAGYVFSPPLRRYTGLSDNRSREDFIAVSSPGYGYFSIGGRVRDRYGVGIPGVIVILDGVRTSSVVTGADGGYRFLNCGAGGYTVSAYRPNMTFDPPVRLLSPLAADRLMEDFTETPYVVRLYPGEVRVIGGLFGPARPNYREHVRVVYLPSRNGEVSMHIRDLRGRLVWFAARPAARYEQGTFTWECTTGEGRPIAAGVYQVEVSGAGVSARLRIAVIR